MCNETLSDHISIFQNQQSFFSLPAEYGSAYNKVYLLHIKLRDCRNGSKFASTYAHFAKTERKKCYLNHGEVNLKNRGKVKVKFLSLHRDGVIVNDVKRIYEIFCLLIDALKLILEFSTFAFSEHFVSND